MADLKAARESGLMAQVTTGRSAVAPASSVGSDIPDSAPATATGTRKEQFAAARDTGGDLNPSALVAPASPNSLLAGSVIAASLITGLDSDLPGMVTAQVTQNVFDTVTGTILLVPQGARLIGKYDSVVAFGQRRALVIWQRLILPDGGSVRLDNMPATDPEGYAGLADRVDFHTWTLLKGVAVATMLGVGSELSIGGDGDLVQAIRQSAQTNAARAGDQITQRNLDIQPTITIRPGAPVRVLVTHDLILAPWRGKEN
ncbi:TrbI/VirB10 family protein [Sphingomonas yabuuchiae]|uniref:TrbI/VirB10 family protein n=1 Tax=Sphingomonas yabuuchiae TaxID=172044 RepID=UPI0031F6CCCF